MSTKSSGFADLQLPEPLLRALEEVGYEQPSPIQAQTIPPLLAGHDLLGTAQTGTGKTAAFALPLLAGIDLKRRAPQVLVLTPTRELAIQVAEAFHRYAAKMPGFQVAPIYGGQDMRLQIRQLERGAHVVVGTPGRVMDHLRRKTLRLETVRGVVLDEADEMLRMGFIDDVTEILDHAPEERQVALFSATMPRPIRQVAERYLRKPVEIHVEAATRTVERIEQVYWLVSGLNKLDALTRMLEVESFDALLIFVRTKTATVELAEKLEARGFAAAALNGDMKQAMRERTVEQLKKGKLDVIVATDVAARGIDVARISHVVNYDIPYDTESYIHRIGRTGRAGREGKAILFVAPRERRMLSYIERATRQPIAQMRLPTLKEVANRRAANFMDRINAVMNGENLEYFEQLVDEIGTALNTRPQRVAAALAYLAQQDNPIRIDPELLQDEPRERVRHEHKEARPQPQRAPREAAEQPRPERKPAERKQTAPPRKSDPAISERPPREPEKKRERTPIRDESAAPQERPAKPNRKEKQAVDMDTYRIEVGTEHGVRAGDIVGAIANEADLDPAYIGEIKLFDDHSLVQLPSGMPSGLLKHLKRVWIRNRKMSISPVGGKPPKKPAPAVGDEPPRKRLELKPSTSKPRDLKRKAKKEQKKGKRARA